MVSKNPTSGFRLTHVGLRVTDIDRSVAFYTSVFGMKELGRMELDTTTVVFLGYPDAADPQTHLFAREGVLELKSQKGMVESSYYPDFRFVKLAIGVPDMAKAMEYIRTHDIKIVKESGVAQGSEVVSTFLGCDTPDKA
ncbi:hypothetical protein N7505_007892 [Penicillium chrysogenum]|uniref:VOC domain-containing protein n=1 Tax=Penicillium chrysogenum TaxID=5076 RepID=A0ABQ8WEW5_PENCH|nr:hypothetical protein N7505_007892 [Penicillium chrysogenum]